MFFFLTHARRGMLDTHQIFSPFLRMTPMRLKRLLLGALLPFLFACKEQPNADVADVPLTLEFARADSLMWACAQALKEDSTLSAADAFAQFLKPDEDFFRAYRYVAERYPKATQAQQDSLLALEMYSFLREPSSFYLLDTVRHIIPFEEDILGAILPPLKRFRRAFPDQALPAFRTHVNGYNPYDDIQDIDQVIVTSGDRYISLGLHFFLGKDFGFYPPNLPNYIRSRFHYNYLATALMAEISRGMVAPLPDDKSPSLLDQMIHLGIKQYFLQEMLPYTADSVRLRYSPAQMAWANTFEKRIFNELMKDGNLFKTDVKLQRDYLSEKPYTTSLALESAPRLGEYAGWRIVQSYMEEHPEIDLAQLVQDQDYERIFREAKYRPK